MTAYLCKSCGCIHGWLDHPLVTKVTRYERYGGEDVWYCPKCSKEHRTTDGSLFGQVRKMWAYIDLGKEAEDPVVQVIYAPGYPFSREPPRFIRRSGKMFMLERHED